MKNWKKSLKQTEDELPITISKVTDLRKNEFISSMDLLEKTIGMDGYQVIHKLTHSQKDFDWIVYGNKNSIIHNYEILCNNIYKSKVSKESFINE